MTSITKQQRSYRKSITPAQSLYSELCSKAKTRPDPVLSDGLTTKGLICRIDKWSTADCAVVGQLSRRLKGYTHVHMSNNTAGGAGGRGSNTARRKGRRSAPQVGPGDEEMIMLCNSIAKSLSMCPKLTVIELPGVALGHGALRQLGKGLAVTTSLKRLDLTNCGLGDEGLGVLSKALISCKSLNDLGLSGNRLKDNSATRISWSAVSSLSEKFSRMLCHSRNSIHAHGIP